MSASHRLLGQPASAASSLFRRIRDQDQQAADYCGNTRAASDTLKSGEIDFGYPTINGPQNCRTRCTSSDHDRHGGNCLTYREHFHDPRSQGFRTADRRDRVRGLCAPPNSAGRAVLKPEIPCKPGPLGGVLLHHEQRRLGAGLGLARRGLGGDRKIALGAVGSDRSVADCGFRHQRKTFGAGTIFRGGTPGRDHLRRPMTSRRSAAL